MLEECIKFNFVAPLKIMQSYQKSSDDIHMGYIRRAIKSIKKYKKNIKIKIPILYPRILS